MSNPETKPVQGGGAFVVAPNNIGKGIIWNDITKTYEVNIGEGLEINSEGKIVVKNNPILKLTDNGTGTIVHQQAVVDTGATIEISGTVMLPLPADPESLLNMGPSTPAVLAYRDKQAKIYGHNLLVYGGCARADGKALGLSFDGPIEPMYYHEVGMSIDISQFGISKVIACSATAGDVYGFRKETAWIVNQIEGAATSVPVGVHTYFSKGQLKIPVSYTIKGIKASYRE